MISYEPFWEYLKKNNISTYKLERYYHFSNGLVDRLKHNRPIQTTTLEMICDRIGCDITDVMTYLRPKDWVPYLDRDIV